MTKDPMPEKREWWTDGIQIIPEDLALELNEKGLSDPVYFKVVSANWIEKILKQNQDIIVNDQCENCDNIYQVRYSITGIKEALEKLSAIRNGDV